MANVNILDPDGGSDDTERIADFEERIDAGEEVELSTEHDPDLLSRDDKKGNRYREANDRAKDADRRAEDADRRAEGADRREKEATGRISRLEEMVHSLASTRQPGETKNEFDDRIQSTRDEGKALWTDYEQQRAAGNKVDPETYRQKAYALEDKLQETQFLRMAKKHGIAPPQPSDDATKRLMTHYPGVMENDNARLYARGEWNRLRATGEPNTWQTVQKAFSSARQQFKIGTEPTDSDRRRLSGTSKGSSGKPPPKTMKMGKMERQMADAAFGHLPEDKRYQHFAQRIGSKRED